MEAKALKTMKKLISFILIIASVMTLASCAKYKPQKSTDQELTTAMTLSIEDKTYEVPYELYRAFFLQLKSAVDGGDESVWTGADKEKYVEKIDSLILSRVTDIYALFHLCEKVGIDVYSRDVEKTLDNYVTASVDGGIVDGIVFEGFNGDYDAYLKSLKDMNLNYSVQRLLLRYSLASELLDFYYIGNLGDKEFVADTVIGALRYTEEDVRNFYFSDSCVRVLEAFLSTSDEVSATVNTPEKAEKIRSLLLAATTEKEAGTVIISNTLATESVRNGLIIARHNLDPMYYEKLTETAFSLGRLMPSEVMTVNTGYDKGYMIIIPVDKTEENFKNCYDDITYEYLQNTIGSYIYEAKQTLTESAVVSDFLNSLDRASVSIS